MVGSGRSAPPSTVSFKPYYPTASCNYRAFTVPSSRHRSREKRRVVMGELRLRLLGRPLLTCDDSPVTGWALRALIPCVLDALCPPAITAVVAESPGTDQATVVVLGAIPPARGEALLLWLGGLWIRARHDRRVLLGGVHGLQLGDVRLTFISLVLTSLWTAR